MTQTHIAAKASFEDIRYAQVWEDADVLVEALRGPAKRSFLSICSAGDNALALLTLDPERVVAVDLSAAQIQCLEIRRAAYETLPHDSLLGLMGSRPMKPRDRIDALRFLTGWDGVDGAFWLARQEEIAAHGLGGAGKFERYFRTFRTKVLPLVHDRRAVESIFEPRSASQREEFLDRVWNSWRWRLMLRVFFSRPVMGRLGRDPAFFDHVEGSVSQHVAKRIREAFVTQDPSANPYLHWLMLGTHGDALPLALRRENHAAIRSRLSRVETVHGPLEGTLASNAYDGFNLSDIFEYMPERDFESLHGKLVDASRPGARLAYWNMMAPRACPQSSSATELLHESEALHAKDKAFFYRAFHVDEVP